MRDPDAAARLQLTKAIQRSKFAIAWERGWPHLARLLTVVGLFLVVSWAGLWLALPFTARAIGLGLFALLACVALVPMLRFRWPSREEALSRLDRGSGVRHRPATELTDTLATPDPVARALWQAQRERTLASIKRIRARLPSPRLAIHDPWALRAVVLLLLVATYVAAGDERLLRTKAAFDWNGMLAPANVRVDAWVTPPLYTGKPPVILTAANKDSAVGNSADAAPLPVPAGSTLLVRSSGGSLDVTTSGGLTEAKSTEQAPQGTSERRFTIAGDGTAHVRAPSGQPEWKFSAVPDHAPSISLAKDPERMARGSLQLSYKLEDDYGVTEAQAHFAARPDNELKNDVSKGNEPKGDTAPRPLFDPPQFALALPNARTRNGVGQTVKDLSENPYAGADVALTLTAKDEAGNEAHSEPFNMRLPERLFTKPLARALIEQRRILALDANQRDQVHTALDALMIEPEMFTPETGQYLGLYDVTRQLEAAHTDDALRGVVASLWALAVTIEDGNISDVDKALRAAQDALKQALERGASDEEIKKLTQDLRAALDNFLRQFAEQQRNNPQALNRPLDPNTRVMRQQDLDDMIQRMERLSRSGDKDAAKQLLDQLESMLENLQMAQPGQSGDSDMNQALNELGDVIRKQQQLRDKTFKEGQDARHDRLRGKQGGDQNLGDLQQDQQSLRDRLDKLQQELARRGLNQQGQRGQKGEQGQDGQNGDQQQGDNGDPLGDAESAMNDAGSKLGNGNADGAVDAQGKALDALRKGAQNMAEAMQQGDGDGQSNGPSNRPGRQQNSANATDPLGRPLRTHESDDLTVKIPGDIDVQRARRILEELRRRLADPSRPQEELDYLQRLLKDY
ncbi:MAG TPA: TIGR02302 family protein [Bradyrhizobium sp.]|nr:TIGR02302 family protein [Bradyrhizobium sp.]